MSKNKTLILSEADAVTLFTNGSLTKDGVTVQEADAIVFVPDNSVQWADVGSGANKVAQRNASGNLETGTPTDSDDAANKKYVDDKVANFVTTNTAQTISGVKTFSVAPLLNNNIGLQWKNSSGTAVDVIKFSNTNHLTFNVPGGITAINSTFKPYNSNDATWDLGLYTDSSTKARWRNLYLSGNLSDGTNSVSIANIVKKSADLTANNFVVGNGGANVKISAMKPVTSTDSSWDSTSDTKVPTMKAISAYVQAQIQAAITTALTTPV